MSAGHRHGHGGGKGKGKGGARPAASRRPGPTHSLPDLVLPVWNGRLDIPREMRPVDRINSIFNHPSNRSPGRMGPKRTKPPSSTESSGSASVPAMGSTVTLEQAKAAYHAPPFTMTPARTTKLPTIAKPSPAGRAVQIRAVKSIYTQKLCQFNHMIDAEYLEAISATVTLAPAHDSAQPSDGGDPDPAPKPTPLPSAGSGKVPAAVAEEEEEEPAREPEKKVQTEPKPAVAAPEPEPEPEPAAVVAAAAAVVAAPEPEPAAVATTAATLEPKPETEAGGTQPAERGDPGEKEAPEPAAAESDTAAAHDSAQAVKTEKAAEQAPVTPATKPAEQNPEPEPEQKPEPPAEQAADPAPAPAPDGDALAEPGDPADTGADPAAAAERPGSANVLGGEAPVVRPASPRRSSVFESGTAQPPKTPPRATDSATAEPAPAPAPTKTPPVASFVDSLEVDKPAENLFGVSPMVDRKFIALNPEKAAGIFGGGGGRGSILR